MSAYEDRIEKLLSDDSFVAWIEGAASTKEEAEWAAWLENDPARKQLVEEARSFHQSIRFQEHQRPEAGEELKRLNQAVDGFEKSHKRKGRNNLYLNNRPNKSYFAVAALVLLLVTVLSIATMSQRPGFFQSRPVENSTQKFITESTASGQQKVLTLSDGSTITLNANSSLKYPSHYRGNDLEVWLKGEAYFDIARKTGSEARSFVVNIPGGAVEVVGTRFNVNAYEQAAEVVLEEGRVDIQRKDTSGHLKDAYTMRPGELARISKLKDQISASMVETDLYTAWTREKLIFDRTPLAEVAQRISHIYGVRFQMNGRELEEMLVSGSLPNNNLEVFLNTLESMLNRRVTHRNGIIRLGEQKSDVVHE